MKRIFIILLIISLTSLIGSSRDIENLLERDIENIIDELINTEIFREHTSVTDTVKLKIGRYDYNMYKNSLNYEFVDNQSGCDVELRDWTEYCKNIFILEFVKEDILRVVAIYDETKQKWTIFRAEIINEESPLFNTMRNGRYGV